MEAAAATALPFAAVVAPAFTATSARAAVAVGRARRPRRSASVVAKLEGGLGKGVPTTNYVVPLDKATGMTRPLVEILRDLNKRVPDKIIDPDTNTVPWYHANRMLSFYAPDGEAYRDATGTAQVHEGRREDAVAEAEEAAFCKACARFGFGLYLYHQDDIHRDEYSFH